MQDKDVGTFKERNIYNFEKSTQVARTFLSRVNLHTRFHGIFLYYKP